MPFLRNKKELGLLISLLSALGVGPVLVFGLSAVSDLIISDLGISEAQFGLVATVCFGFGAFGNILLARFADRHRDAILFTVIFGFSAGGQLQDISQEDMAELPDLGSGFNTSTAWRHELARLEGVVSIDNNI